MTCREKLRVDYPEFADVDMFGGCSGCPHTYGYLPIPDYCDPFGNHDTCNACWDREIPGTEKMEEKTMATTKKTKAELLEELEQANQNVRDLKNEIKNLERYKQYENMADEIKALHTAFMNSGFTNEQAFDLLKTMTQAVIPTALRGVDVCPRYNG